MIITMVRIIFTKQRPSLRLAAAALVLVQVGACSPDKDGADADAAADPLQDEAGDVQVEAEAPDLPVEGADGDVPAEPDEEGEFVPPSCDPEDPQPPPPDSGIVWDPRLSGTGEDTLGGHGHDDGLGPVGWCGSSARPHWGLTEALFESDEDNESGGNHNIYIEVLDESGARIVGQEVIVSNGVESWSIFTEDKPPPEYAANYPMWGGNVYSVLVAGDSDMVFNMRMPNNHHVNFLLTFQRIP